MGEALEGVLSGHDEMLCRVPAIARLLEVHRDDRGELATPFGVQRQERLRRELVERAAVLFEQ